jgi:hypothetical protein
MKVAVPLRIVVVAPPVDVVYGIQRGRGSAYEVAFAERLKQGDVTFEFAITAAEGKDGAANFLGEYVQGPAGRRFIYVDVGRAAPATRHRLVAAHDHPPRRGHLAADSQSDQGGHAARSADSGHRP